MNAFFAFVKSVIFMYCLFCKAAVRCTSQGQEPSSVVTLAFVGDISFDSAVRYFHKKGVCPYNTTFQNVASFLREADLAIANLESPLINSDIRHDAQLQFSPLLSADPDSTQALSFAGIDIVTLANNHYNDYGSRPVDYSVELLSKIGVQTFGYTYGRKEDDKPQTPLLVEVSGIRIGFLGYCSAYREQLTPEGKVYFFCIEKRGNLAAGPAIYSDEAATRDVNNLKTPLLVEVSGIRIGFLGYCSAYREQLTREGKVYFFCIEKRGNLAAGPAIYSDEAATRDVNDLKGKVDVIVVFMHWGAEYLTDPTERQKKEASHLQSLGAQIIIGSHPHVLEGHITSGTNMIAYSLGNFLFAPKNRTQLFYCNRQPSEKTVKKFEEYIASPAGLADPTTHSRIMRVQIDKKGFVAASYLPLRINLDPTSKCLQPTPTEPAAKWIAVCSPDDKACIN